MYLPSPLAYFVFPLCFWFCFGGWSSLFKVGKTTFFFLNYVSQHHKNPQMKNSANQCYWFSHTYTFFCSSMLSFLEAQLSMPSQQRKIIQNKKVFPWLAFLICLTFLLLSQLSRCFCSSLNPALTGSHQLKGLLIYSTLVTWGSTIPPIYLTKYSPNEIEWLAQRRAVWTANDSPICHKERATFLLFWVTLCFKEKFGQDALKKQ